ncbi:unnamed protein product [Cunninghamella blakesleeana]
MDDNSVDEITIQPSSAPVKIILPELPLNKTNHHKQMNDNEENTNTNKKAKLNPTRPSLLNTKSFTHSVSSFYQLQEDRWNRNHHETKETSATTSVGKALLMYLKAFIGSGVLFLPKGFQNGGLLLSILLMIIIASLCLYSFLKLVKTQQIIGGTYGDVANRLYGKYICYLVLFFIVLSQLGFVCSYFIFISGNLVNIFQVLSHCQLTMIPQKDYIWFPLLIVLPLVMIRHMAKLSFTVIIADVFILFGLVCVLYFTIVQLIDYGVGPNIQMVNSDQFGLMISTSIFSFEGIGLGNHHHHHYTNNSNYNINIKERMAKFLLIYNIQVIPIAESMENPEKFPFVVYIGTIIVCIIYILIGSISYLAYGDQMKAAVIYNFPSSHGLTITSQLLYSIAVILTIPFMLFPAIKIIETELFKYGASGSRDVKIKWLKNLFRCSITTLCAIAAYMIGGDHLDKFVAFVGSISCIALCYIFPGLFHYKIAKNQWEKVIDCMLVFFGISIMIYTLFITISGFFQTETPLPSSSYCQ